MNLCRWIAISILVLPATVLALQPSLEIIERFGDLRVVAFVNAGQIDRSPAWSPESSAPPLTVEEAVEAVAEFIEATPDVREIDLKPLPRFEDRWHYLIKLPAERGRAEYEIYMVLMDGKVVPALIEPESYK